MSIRDTLLTFLIFMYCDANKKLEFRCQQLSKDYLIPIQVGITKEKS